MDLVGEKQGSLPGRDFQAGEMQCKGPVGGVWRDAGRLEDRGVILRGKEEEKRPEVRRKQ